MDFQSAIFVRKPFLNGLLKHVVLLVKANFFTKFLFRICPKGSNYLLIPKGFPMRACTPRRHLPSFIFFWIDSVFFGIFQHLLYRLFIISGCPFQRYTDKHSYSFYLILTEKWSIKLLVSAMNRGSALIFQFSITYPVYKYDEHDGH